MDTMTTTAGNIATFNHGLIAAMMKSGQAWATGYQTFSFSMAAGARAQLDRNVSFCKEVANAKSPLEVMELQRDLARSIAVRFIEDAGKLSHATAGLVEQTVTPFRDRLTTAVGGWAAHLNTPHQPD